MCYSNLYSLNVRYSIQHIEITVECQIKLEATWPLIFFFYFTAGQREGKKGWVEEGKGERGNGDICYSVNNKVKKQKQNRYSGMDLM